jgi:hypothetical protein
VPGLRFKPVDENVLVHDPGADMIHVLNAPAATVLELADGSRSVADIAAELAGAHAAGSERALADVTAILAEFERLGLVSARRHRST